MGSETTDRIRVLKFQNPQGAEEALDLVKSLSKQHLITLQDAAIVTNLSQEEEKELREAFGA